jgi:ketosteroid isomerase-like protein
MPSRERVNAFVAAVRDGRYVEAIADFYWPEASMCDNQGEARGGRDALIAHEKATMARVRSIITREAGPVLVDGDRVAVRWLFEFTLPDGAVRRLEEIAWQTWRGDRILEERFFFDPAQFQASTPAAM